MKLTVNSNLLRVAALGLLLTACQAGRKKSAELPVRVTGNEAETIEEIEPDDHLYKALEAFGKNEYVKSASEINKAAQSVKEIALATQGIHKNSMASAASALEALASKVKNNEVKDLGVLSKVFGKTGRALAGNRLHITENEYFNSSQQKSGALLKTTIDQLEKSISSHDRALTQNEQQKLQDAREIASRLQKGDKVDEEDLKGTIQSINSEIEKWDREFEKIGSHK